MVGWGAGAHLFKLLAEPLVAHDVPRLRLGRGAIGDGAHRHARTYVARESLVVAQADVSAGGEASRDRERMANLQAARQAQASPFWRVGRLPGVVEEAYLQARRRVTIPVTLYRLVNAPSVRSQRGPVWAVAHSWLGGTFHTSKFLR